MWEQKPNKFNNLQRKISEGKAIDAKSGLNKGGVSSYSGFKWAYSDYESTRHIMFRER